ncbi:hypothetical protein AVEN_118680-1 [Araneus ventricosus]|uniref:Uncharacterized protein n=1 Tax=Araneus ventricosus TaxID=182803 RepID=A0A4Y2AYP5_ARAVE|nr:hypothetical protein AVEN_118680-1 [Araneus ventricosus]
MVKICAQQLKEVLHSLNASLMSMFGSDVPIELTSMQEKGENLMGQDRHCRGVDPIYPIPGDECVLLCTFLGGVLHYNRRTNPSTQETR